METGNTQKDAQAAPPSTNESLLIRLRDSGNDDAWREFVEVYSPLLYGYCRKRGLQDADAQDVTQDVCVEVSRAIRTFEYDPQKGRFRGWLGTLTQRAITQRLRKAQRHRAVAEGGEGSLPDEASLSDDPEWIEHFQQRVLEVAISRIRDSIDADVWRAFELIWLEGQSPSTAAAVLGKPKPWTYKAKFNVLRRLREQIENLTADVAFYQR